MRHPGHGTGLASVDATRLHCSFFRRVWEGKGMEGRFVHTEGRVLECG